MDQRFTTSIAILLLISLGLACSFLGPRRQLTWFVMLEIDPAVPNREDAVKQTIAVIESRLNALGLSSSKVQAEGTPPNGQILVSLPDVPDPERLKKIIIAAGRLELTAVVSLPSPAPVQTYRTKEEAEDSLGGRVPNNRRVLEYAEGTEPGRAGQTAAQTDKPPQWVVVEWPAIVGGKELRNASAIPSRTGSSDYQIAFSFKPSGAEKFGTWTGANINQYMGVVLDDKVKSIAYIKAQIFDQGEISGRFTKQSAEDLALVLRSGALPAAVKIVSEGANK